MPRTRVATYSAVKNAEGRLFKPLAAVVTTERVIHPLDRAHCGPIKRLMAVRRVKATIGR